MAKYAGLVGYATQEEVRPGVWEEVIKTHKMRGDILRARVDVEGGDKTNDDLSLNNRFSLLASPKHFENFENIRFITYLGVQWKVTSVEIQYPRLILEVGGRWNGPTGETGTTPDP